jgi:hypothetical protein
LLAGARFCRRCGTPSRAADQSSVSEAETKVLQATDDRSAQTQYHDPRPTGPSYIAPNEAGFPHAPTAMEPEPTRVKRHGILWASAILVVLLFLFGAALALKWSRTSTVPAPTTKIEVPPETGVAPPVAPQPPQPPAVEKGNGSGLIYPGAEVTMEMTRGAEGSVRQLRTKDSFDKVVAWYTDKLKPTNETKIADKAILSGKNTTAIISQDDDETSILLKEGIDQ